MRIVTYVEIDIDYCALRYGETTGAGTCPAVLGDDSEAKCFNSPKTCPVRDSFVNQPATLRFAMARDDRGDDIEAIPAIKSVSMTPATVSLGKDLGQRATLNVTLFDLPFADTGPGFDKYVDERDYNPYERGTFWGKFRARHPYLRGRKVRLITGEIGQAIGDMETRHYVLESFDGPSLTGEYTLVAKDVLKLADGDRAQAPRASNGYLQADINSSTTSATLTPSGIGNAEYPASGYCAIGGNEICAFTRSGDSLTLTRGQLGTAGASHSAQDRVQLCLRYSAEDVADIIRDLLVNYAGVSADYIPLTEWQVETATYLGRVYTGTIGEPTSVATLLSELIEQAALALWWDDTRQKLNLQVLRGVVSVGDEFNLSNILENTLKTKEQPESRLSRVQTYYGQINPLVQLTNTVNYRSMAETADEQAEEDYGSAAIKTVFSRWMPAFGRTSATRLNAILLSRFRDPPRRVNLSVLRGAHDSDLRLAAGYQLGAPMLQDETGAAVSIPIQVTQINPKADRLDIQAEEILFNAPDEDLTQRSIIIDSNSYNLNLRTIHDQIYPPLRDGDTVNVTVETGIIVGSTSTGSYAMDTGTWPSAVTLNLIVKGRIQGKGGAGAKGGNHLESGVDWVQGGTGAGGGPALKVRKALSLTATGGQIFGGGGGGGGGGGRKYLSQWDAGGGGGGGRGSQPGPGGEGNIGDGGPSFPSAPGAAGTTEIYGAGGAAPRGSTGVGGRGGDAGEAGQYGGFVTSPPADPVLPEIGSGFGYPGPGGPPGAAIDGWSLVTVAAAGDVRGPKIN